MTNGEPGGASRTAVMYMYTLLRGLRFADSTALAIMLFAIIMAITLTYRLFFKDDPDV